MDIHWLNDDRMHPACGGLFATKRKRTPLFQPLQKEGPEDYLKRFEAEKSNNPTREQSHSRIDSPSTGTRPIGENYRLPPYILLTSSESPGIEVPNTHEQAVHMRPILESEQFTSKSWILPLVLGRDSDGCPFVVDLASMPHLLIAGNGAEKSNCVNSILMSIMVLRKPDAVKLILVDPNRGAMSDFKGIPHLLAPVVTDLKLAAGVLPWAVKKMEERRRTLSHMGVRSIATFNRMTREERLARVPRNVESSDYDDPMPYIVIVVDEFAALMMTAGKEIQQAINQLAQKARATGIHVILATQRRSPEVVTGQIKANLQRRICFKTPSKFESRIILDKSGAEKLASNSDMFFIDDRSNLARAKNVHIANDEIRGVVQYCKDHAEPEHCETADCFAAQINSEDPKSESNRQEIKLDKRFLEAVEVFLSMGRASASLLQRRMGLSFTRAARLCDQMEARGIVGPDRGAHGRELLLTWQHYEGNLKGPGSASGDKSRKYFES